jgi:hypothetical protein
MNNIKLNVEELYQVLKLTPIEQNILLIGKHGIGKSEIITAYYENERSMKVQSFFLGQMSDPGDLIGLLNKDEKTGKSVFMPPFWWPTENEPIVLFLDELNRARPELLQAVQDLTLNRTLAGKVLPKGSIIVSAINEGDEYQLTELDPALVSRFNVYNFDPTIKDWLIWANKNNVDKRIIAFIQKNEVYLDNNLKNNQDNGIWSSSIQKSPDRRAWKKLSDFIQNIDFLEDIHIKIIAGIIGIEAALIFKKYNQENRSLTPEAVLLNFKFQQKIIEKLELENITFLNEQMIYWINNKNYDVKNKKTISNNFLKYIELLKEIKMEEGIAHLASMLEDKNFSHASSMLLIDNDKIMDKLVDYIQNIDIL